ncbi:MAG TPA: outer membrane beta-barrel protein, partial [Bdellovibrionota bacterium]|nr:outer membrane beta-barrel protein [Bdellovibrionota bacterium]
MVNLILALAMALALPASAAETSTCARIKVSGAGDCAQLKASLDISRCSDSKAVGSTQVQCEGEHARLTLKARKTTYTAAVELGPESWGVRKWVPKGPVARESQATHAEFQRRPAPPAKEAASEAAPAASATPAPAPALAPSATPAPAAPSVTFNGLFDLYYAYGFNRPRPAVNSFRNFDFFDNEFALNLVELTMQAQVGKVAFKTDLDFGEMADAMNGGIGTADEVAKHIGQAVVTFTPNDRFTLNVGKMATHMGFEVTKAR